MAVERVDIGQSGSPWREEHAARYHWAGPYTQGLEVLDIACGTGFGSRILVQSGAGRVTAADISEEALALTRELLAPFGDRVRVRKEDGGDITLPDASFDVVTSMETVEHVPDAAQFLAEIHRVLRPGGKLLLSTPNALVTNPGGGKPDNPFHVCEFTPTEMRDLLERWFQVEMAVGQHLPPGYGVAPFLPSFRKADLDLLGKLNFLYWRVLLRLGPVRDFVHRAFTGFSFYPREDDYTFRPSDLDRAHTQLWVCLKQHA
ncbi:class I SAM-dependent methyltransferase [Gemmatimonadota bacterium]